MSVSLINFYESPNHISKRWLWIARLVWVLLLLVALGKLTLGVPIEYAEMNQVCTFSAEVCDQGESLITTQVMTLQSFGLSLNAYARIVIAWKLATSLIWAGMGVFIFLMRPDEWMAWIASAMMIVYISAGYEAQIWSAYPALGTASDLIFNLGNVLLFLFIGLFPNGRFSPRWMRWYWLGMILVTVLLFLVDQKTDFLSTNPTIENAIIFIYWISFLVLGPYSQIYRYRNDSSATERQQTKWVVLGFTVFTGAMLVGSAIIRLFPISELGQLVYQTIVFDLAGLLIPLSIGISVMRYRLWDIDVIVRKTMIYGLLTTVLALVFFGGIALLQSLFLKFSNQQSEISIVISTLAIAALFNPLRRRFQNVIDRRFYRRKYDAQKMVERFSDAARNEVEIEQLTAHLMAVVTETMQPEQVTVWLKPPPAHFRKATL